MKRKNFTAEQIIRVLREVDTGSSSVAQTCRRHGISEVTFYRWRKRYQGMNLTEAKRLKKLTAENARLKRMVADRELELDALKEILEKKTLSVAERREVARYLMTKGLSKRQSCRLAGISRTGYHYLPRSNDDEEVIAERVAYARRRPRFGYRRAYRFVHNDRPTINHKRVQRLWQRAKLQVLPRRRRKRRRDPQRRVPLQAFHPRHVITYDFMEDSTINGRTLRILTRVDEFTWECLALYVARSIPSAKVISVLARVVARYGAPEFIRSDNGPEFIAEAVCSWILFQGAQTHHIDPAAPWQNAYGESFNARLRDECLNLEEFTSVVEAQVILDAWRKDYNTRREHSGIGHLSPTEFYAAWLAGQS